MKLTIITIFAIVIFMCLIQLFYRDGFLSSFSVLNQEKFRRDNIKYYSDKFIMFPTDGRERSCKLLKEDKRKLKNSELCEGYRVMKNTKYDDKVEKCRVVNDISDWRVRINKIPTDVIDGEKGCGFCFDNKQVMYGNAEGPFTSSGKKVCDNWLKPGKTGKGGTKQKKNIFAEYPNPIKKFTDMFRKRVNRGVKYDTQKMYEQELCKSLANCGQTTKYLKPNGDPLCGWCLMGRKGDGKGEGMVIKNGRRYRSSEPKYKDDYCPWPREIKKNTDGSFEKTNFYRTFDTKELKMWGLYKKIKLIERGNSQKAMKLIKQYKDENKLEELEKLYSEKTRWWWWYKKYGAGSINSKLLKDSGECQVVEELFPCFKNFSTGPHSEDCYADIWNYMAIGPHNCSGNFRTRIAPNLPNSKTFKEWDRGYIPSVEDAIGNIPKRANESTQYAATFTNNAANHPSENLLSAMRNSLACFGKPGDACDDKYRSKEFKYPRPKQCIDTILTNAGLPRSNPKYDPKNSGTYQYYWAVVNDINWKNGIHYDWSNSKYKEMIEEKKKEFKNLQNIKNNRFSYKYSSSALHPYDIVLLSSYYLYGEAKGQTKLWQDHDGSMSKYWVKMCYEDFRDSLKALWGAKDKNFLTLTDKIDIGSYTLLKKKVLDKNFIFTYKSESGINVKIELIDDRYITKQLYEHPYFPFWRMLPQEYYITHLYRRLQARENAQRRGGCRQYASNSLCNKNPTCKYWGNKCRKKLIITKDKQNYYRSKKLCSQKFGGKLANVDTSNYNYIKRKVKSNRRKFGYNWFSRKIGKKSGPWVGNSKAFTQYYNARPVGWWSKMRQKRKAICELDFAK